LDIIKLPIEYPPGLVDSRFRLVLMTAQRARQLTEGSPVLVKSKYVKNITLGLEEAIEGKLRYLTGDEAKRAREYEYRLRRERMARESMEEATVSLEKIEEIKETYKAETAAHFVKPAGVAGVDEIEEEIVDEVADETDDLVDEED